MASPIDPNDFDANMELFYMGLAERHWDKAVVTLLNMENIVAKQTADETTQQARKEILQNCRSKIQSAALQQLQKHIDEDSPAKAVVIWEKTKVSGAHGWALCALCCVVAQLWVGTVTSMLQVLGCAEAASELYRTAFCQMVQEEAVLVLSRLQSIRELAGVAQLRSNLSTSLGDSEESRKKYVTAVSDLLNIGYSKVRAILSYGLRDDVDLSIALSVTDKIVSWCFKN